MHTTPITLADVTIRLETPEPVRCTSNFRPFLGEGGGPSVRAAFSQAPVLPEIAGRPEFENLMFSVHRTAEGFIRRYRDQDGRFYAVGRMTPEGAEVCYLPWSRAYFSETHNCFSHIALEELLLSCGRLILHAAFVAAGERGLLFSGPSGIGKSTQAALWERHGARLLNGDRTVLGPGPAGWTAWGSPYAGSSRCFCSEQRTIGAIVVLEQAPVCTARRLSAAEAFHRLYPHLTVNSWSSAYVERASGLLAELTDRVPVYLLACTPDDRAVETLAKVLKEDNALGFEGSSL